MGDLIFAWFITNDSLTIISNSNMKHSSSKSQLVTAKPKIANDKTDSAMGTTRIKTHSKSTINPRDNQPKPIIKTKDQPEVTYHKKQQLFTIIETFYSTLCDLPLEKLISSGEPDIWLCQQEATLAELSKKLTKFANDTNSQYYRWKLNSVQSILGNIKQNMSMMARINHLKNYYSGTDSSNYRSRTSSSCESERRDVKLGDLANIQQKTAHQLLSYDQYVIKQEKMIDQNPSLQIEAQTVNSDSEQSMSRSQFFSKNKETKRQRKVPQQGQNRNISNFTKKLKTTEQQTLFNSREMKDKTLSKVNNPKTTNSQRTLSNYTLEGRFLEDKIMNQMVKNIKSIENSQRQNQSNTVESSKLEQGNTMNEETSKESNMAEYVQMIKELRCELMNKDKQIERLLINQQQYEQALEMMKEREKNKNKEIMFLKQGISNSSRDKEKLQLQIKRLLEFQEELKDTIRFERQRNKKDEQQMEKLEEKYEEQSSEKQQLRAQIERLNQQNKQSRKNLRVMKEKLDVYSKKYFLLHEQVQTYKETEKQLMEQICELRSGDGPSKYQKIRDLIEYHKSVIADESQL